MAELKPCPFCGGEARLWIACAKWDPDGSATICGRKVGCTKCRIETVIEDSGIAIEKWNRRAGNGKET